MSDNEDAPNNKSLQDAVRTLELLHDRNIVFVVLSVDSQAKTLDQLSQAMQSTPSYSREVGKPYYKSKKRTWLSHSNSWNLSTRDLGMRARIRKNDLESHLEWMTDYLYDKREILKSLRSTCSFKLSCYLHPFSRHTSFVLEPKIMLRLARLDLKVQIEFHYQNTDAEY